jgi:hypothetical protein
MSIDEILLAVFFTVFFLFLASRSATIETFDSSLDPNLQLTITKKDKTVTCTEASLALTTLIRFIAHDVTGEGAIVLNNIRDTFFEIDEECHKSKKCPAIGLKADLNPDTLYNSWTNPLKCQV